MVKRQFNTDTVPTMFIIRIVLSIVIFCQFFQLAIFRRGKNYKKFQKRYSKKSLNSYDSDSLSVSDWVRRGDNEFDNNNYDVTDFFTKDNLNYDSEKDFNDNDLDDSDIRSNGKDNYDNDIRSNKDDNYDNDLSSDNKDDITMLDNNVEPDNNHMKNNIMDSFENLSGPPNQNIMPPKSHFHRRRPMGRVRRRRRLRIRNKIISMRQILNDLNRHVSPLTNTRFHPSQMRSRRIRPPLFRSGLWRPRGWKAKLPQWTQPFKKWANSYYLLGAFY